MLTQEEYVDSFDHVIDYLEKCQTLLPFVKDKEVKYSLAKKTTNTQKPSIIISCPSCTTELSNTTEYRYCPWCAQKLKYNPETYKSLNCRRAINMGDNLNEEMLQDLIKQYDTKETDTDEQLGDS